MIFRFFEMNGPHLELERFFQMERCPTKPPVQQPTRKKKTPVIPMTRASYIQAMTQLGARPPEQAGILMGPMDSPVVTHFLLDKNGHSSAIHFELDDRYLNGELRKFLELQMEAKGFLHSHPNNCTKLSAGDLKYLRRIWNNPNNDCERIFMPIVVGRKMHAFVVDRDDPDCPKPAQLQLI